MDTVTFNNTIFEFNWMPVNYIDNSWLTIWVNEEALGKIKKQHMAMNTLNEFIFDNLGIMGEVEENEYLTPISQLLLLPSDDLKKIVLFLGVALNHQQIRKIICGSQQKKIRACLGEKAYMFGMSRASFLFENDLLYEVFGSKYLLQENNIYNEIMQSGFELLAILTKDLSDAIKSRLVLKFNNNSTEYLNSCWQQEILEYKANEQHQLSEKIHFESLIFKVAKELYPQWTSILVS
jgi:hypothetical protein